MEPASAMPQMPSFEDELRKGQAEVARRFLTETACVARLPTGYGKTKAAAASYVVLRSRNVVNRLLYIVPKVSQARQAAGDVPREITALSGIRCNAFIIGSSPVPALKAHRSGSGEVFISTIQAIGDSPRVVDALSDLMQTGKWMVIVDEHHHYGDDKLSTSWASRVKQIPHQALLAMSATPQRKDDISPFGKPQINVTYREALEEEAVKRLSLHAYDYRVDAIVTGSGEVVQFTTHELFESAGSDDPADIDKWLSSRSMKWSPRYISPLIMYPVARINSRFAVDGLRTQMIVQALSCLHAKTVCEQIRSLLGEDIKVDWVGTGPNGRTDAENEDVLQRFCPPKDLKGRRNWTLDILVNVGMASEGLDCVDVAEIVFLTSPGLNNSTLQAIGRGARVMQVSEGIAQPICIINVDAASELAAWIADGIMDAFEGIAPEDADPGNPRGEREFADLPDNLEHIKIFKVELINIRTHPAFAEMLPRVEATVREVNPGRDREWLRKEAEQYAEEALRAVLGRHDDIFNQSSLLELKREAVERSTRAIVFEIQRITTRINGTDRRFAGSEFKDVIVRVKSRKNREIGMRPEDASMDELDRHQAWLSHLQREVKAHGVPQWLL